MRNDTRMHFIPRNLWYYEGMLRFVERRCHNEKNCVVFFFFFAWNKLQLIYLSALMRLNDAREKGLSLMEADD